MAYYYRSPIGIIAIIASKKGLKSVRLNQDQHAEGGEGSSIERETMRQLECYFSGGLTQFNIETDTAGTPFQLAVWKALRSIPYGSHCSYAMLAQMSGYPRAWRAVGSANGANPLAIIIPCHRVIKSDGHVGDYAYGSLLKQRLLSHEKLIDNLS